MHQDLWVNELYHDFKTWFQPTYFNHLFFFSSSFYKVLEVHNLKTNFSYIIDCKET